MMKRSSMAVRLLGLLPAAGLISACGGWIGSVDPSATPPEEVAAVPADEPAPAPAPAVDPAPPSTPPAASAATHDLALERQVASLELKLLEREAQVEELQSRLDEARREVVRTMSRMRSLATQTDAAAGIEEAATALEALSEIAADQAAESNQLLELARAEFDRENYGGALYLADEAKNSAAAARGQFAGGGEDTPRADERPFTLPLHLQTTARANVRQGPGTGFNVLFTLPTGSPLVAYSSSEQWLRVADDSGRRGWISQTLIRPRL